MDLLPSTPLSHEVSLFEESGVNLPCVGSIISSYLILTLASCLHGNRNGTGKGRNKFIIKTKSGNGLNSNLKLEEEQIRNISRIIFHPDSTNDLVILVLEENLISSVKILPILNADESTSTNFSGRSCREDSQLSPLQISEPSQCPFSSAFLCLLPLDSKVENSSSGCSWPFPGSSLICSDEKHGQFFCGILALSSENMDRENGQIYINIPRHLNWIESASAQVKDELSQTERETTSFELAADDYDYDMADKFVDFENRPRKTRNVDYDVGRHIAQGMTVNKTDPISYQLSIRYNANLSDGEWEHICGGVILDEKTAITAAHCFDKAEDVIHYRVVAGENRLYRPDAEEQVLPLIKVIIHPEYTYFTDGNDIAILHVDKFRFNKNVAGVWLSPFSNKKLTNKTAVVSGWGDVTHQSGPSLSLQKGNVSILPPEDCLNRLSNRMKNITVREGVLCALDPLVRTCTGDSGGPLVIQNYKLGSSTRNLLVGITSFGARNCSHLNRVGVFTEISSFYNWIQENRVTPLGCGGFIRLRAEKEIVYTVPAELQGEKSVCVWVVAAPGASSIEMELLNNPNVHFQPKETTLFAIYDFKMNASIHSKKLGKDEKCTIDQPFFVLYFRSNSSAPNSGFHILLKEAGERRTQKPVKYLELGLTDGATSEIQEFKYPLPPATNHENNEQTFIIVKPGTLHGRMKLKLKSVQTESNYNWIEITSVKSEPVSHFRFTGQGSWSDKDFEVEEGEPFIIYFHSDGSTTKSGFHFSYFEQSKSAYRVNRDCGGLINLDHVHEIIYKVPSEEPERQLGSTCLWVVSTGRQDAGASIQATILNNPSAQFNPTSDIIFPYYVFDYNNQNKRINQTGTKYTIRGPFITLLYRSISSEQNAGFHMRLRDSISQSNITERLAVKLITVPNADLNGGEIQEFSLPSSVSGVPNSNSSGNERAFLILKPQKPGSRIKVNLKFLNTQENQYFLKINTHRVRPTPLERFGIWTENIFEGLEDEPIFIYVHSFYSNPSDESGGFKIEYSEIAATNASSCGGFIRLRAEHEIVYTVPAELQGEKSVCVWVVAAPGASSIEMELLNNPNVHFQPEESTLFAIYDFNIDAFNHSKILSKDKKWTIDHPFFVLYFRSNSSAPNSGFHIKLKEAGERRAQLRVKYLELTGRAYTATSAVQEFKYPPYLASEYANDERTFVIVKPTTRHSKLELGLKSVRIRFNGWMQITSVKSEPVSHFRFSGEYSWFDNYFETEEDEPFIIYFHSNHLYWRPFFELSYSEQNISDSGVNRHPPRSCGDAMERFPSPRSKKQRIYPHGNTKKVEVLCDFEVDGGGWTTIQKRSSGPEVDFDFGTPKYEFQQNWNEYENGFGSLNRNFWIGLKNIRALTQNGDQELRIELEDFEGNKKYAKYSSFSISDASDFYRLTLGGFSASSTLGDSLAFANGQKFSTINKDNDNYPGLKCALYEGGGGGWWYDSCGTANLNGLYFEIWEYVPRQQGIWWDSWKGWSYSMAKSEMKIRKRKP